MAGRLEPSRRRGTREFFETLAIILVLAVLIRTFVFESFRVEGYSMLPTLQNGDQVLVNRLAFVMGQPKTGEIIVFRSPVTPNQDWIKRVIGLPGETVSIKNNVVYINGTRYPEPFLKYRGSENVARLRVPPGYLWVLGDNRPVSDDSRYFGFLKESRVVGQAVLVWGPISHIRWLS